MPASSLCISPEELEQFLASLHRPKGGWCANISIGLRQGCWAASLENLREQEHFWGKKSWQFSCPEIFLPLPLLIS
jgi:hypothetical protein